MKIAVLGSGLSGLLASYALRCAGHFEYDIITREFTSMYPKGFTLLHDNCGLRDLEDSIIKVIQKGMESNYKKKLGYDMDVGSSWKSGLEEYYIRGWNPIQVIDRLMTGSLTYRRIIEEEISPDNLEDLKSDYDIIISTIPIYHLYEDVEIEYRAIYVRELELDSDPNNPTVIYHGEEPEGGKLRTSMGLWGNDYRELSLPLKGSKRLLKPIRAKGYPEDPQIILAGRKGLWNKNVMAHHVFYKVLEVAKGWKHAR